jgi:hypothetical protein
MRLAADGAVANGFPAPMPCWINVAGNLFEFLIEVLPPI